LQLLKDVRPTQEGLLIYEAQELFFGQLPDVYDGLWRVSFLKIEQVCTTVEKAGEAHV